LRPANSPQELASRLADYAARLPAGRWITGGDWDHERWPGAPLPAKELIDPLTARNPVLVNRLDGHMALANSVALKLAGVTRDTKDPPGGLIVRDRRFRIEHAQHLRPPDVPRFARAGVIASMQPYHCADDGRWAEKRLGPERCKGTYAFRSLLDAGAVLAFGSDWTVAPLDPLQGIAAAVTRRTLDGKHPGGWVPAQKITVEEAVRAFTVGAAFAEFQEQTKGTLAPGKLADLVMLDRDIWRIDPAEIQNARVLLTVMDGRVVFEEKGR
jgi:hypothetical protein